jgi:uncharacterized membrane protein
VQSYRTAATRLRHPVNVALTEDAPLGVRVANATTGFMGSWKFIILLASNQSAVRDRATLEHAASEAEDGDKKDDDLRARLERIEALLQQVTAKG